MMMWSLCCWVGAEAAAAEGPIAKPSTPQSPASGPGDEVDAIVALDSGSTDGISGTIHGRDWILGRPLARGILPLELLDQYQAWRQDVLRRIGLNVALTYDALAMGAINDAADWSGMAGDLAMTLRWQISDDDGPYSMAIATRLRDRHAIGGGSTPSELRAETGAIWGYVDGFNDNGIEIPELYAEQRFFERRLLLRCGQMAIDDLLDDHRMRSPKRSFLNQAFSSSPAVGLPGTGLGFVTRWKSPDGWDLTFAMSNIESTNLDDEADWKFNTNALFEAVQGGYSFTGLNALPARVQLMLWNADELPDFDVPSGRGVSLTLEQQWPRRLRSFVRYAWSEGQAAPANQLLAIGVSRAAGKGELDRIGLAVAAGESSEEPGHWQESLEFFYRYQLGPLHVTPDLQLTVGDGIADDRGWLLLGGVRFGFTF